MLAGTASHPLGRNEAESENLSFSSLKPALSEIYNRGVPDSRGGFHLFEGA